MSSPLRSRLARMGLVAAFIIPIGTTSLRGLTHVLTCSDEVRTPFSIFVAPGQEPVVTTSSRFALDSDEEGCAGLDVSIGARFAEGGALELLLPLSNETGSDWRGTVQISVGDISVPVDLGIVKAGETAERTIELDLPEGTTELDGTLLIGP